MEEFDYSDDKFLVEQVKNYGVENICDENLLEELQHLPRYIGAKLAILDIIKQEVIARGLIIPTVVSLQAWSDDRLAERRNQIRLELSEISRQEEVLKAEREDINQEFIDRFNARGSDGTRTSRFSITLRTDDNYPVEEDREAFEQYILKTKKLYLRQNRISMAAIQEELMALQQEKEIKLKYLKENDYSQEACFSVLEQIAEEFQDYHYLIPRLTTQQKFGGLDVFMNSALDEIYTIPGISIIQKTSINQVKKSK